MSVVIGDMRDGPAELAKKVPNLYEQARQRNMTLTQFVEDEDPTHGPNSRYDGEERALGLDAFGRLLREHRIHTVAVPERGVQADTVEAFGKDENTRYLFAEWVERRKREVIDGPANNPQVRALYSGADQPQGTPVFPINFDPRPYFPQIAPAVPIAEVVAVTTPITGSTYEAYYLIDNTGQKRMVRIVEGAEIPAVKLLGGNHIIKVRKFGRRLDATYEALRRMRIDLLALHIQRMMVQAEVDKLAAIIDVVINGDMSNTSNGATVYTLSSLDSSATPGNAFGLTLRAYLRFKAKFRNPYTVTTMLGNEDVVIATQLLSTGNANIPLQMMMNAGSPFGSFSFVNNETADAVRLGLTDDAPASKLVAMDKRFAINRIVETGGDITEAIRWAEKQTQSLVMTNEENYSILDSLAIKVLDLTS